MEEPKLPGRSGSDGYVLYKYTQAHWHPREGKPDWRKPLPRFRTKDARNDIRDLLIAAMVRNRIVHDFLPFAEASYKQKEEEAVRRTNLEVEAGGVLDWFKFSPEAVFDRDFPRGPAAENEARRKRQIPIINAFRDGANLLLKSEFDGFIDLRLAVQAALRAVFGDRPIFTPKELMEHRDLKFRKSDRLDDIGRLAVDSCRDFAAGLQHDEKAKLQLMDLSSRLNDRVVFDGIAKISGLDRRHKYCFVAP